MRIIANGSTLAHGRLANLLPARRHFATREPDLSGILEGGNRGLIKLARAAYRGSQSVSGGSMSSRLAMVLPPGPMKGGAVAVLAADAATRRVYVDEILRLQMKAQRLMREDPQRFLRFANSVSFGGHRDEFSRADAVEFFGGEMGLAGAINPEDAAVRQARYVMRAMLGKLVLSAGRKAKRPRDLINMAASIFIQTPLLPDAQEEVGHPAEAAPVVDAANDGLPSKDLPADKKPPVVFSLDSEVLAAATDCAQARPQARVMAATILGQAFSGSQPEILKAFSPVPGNHYAHLFRDAEGSPSEQWRTLASPPADAYAFLRAYFASRRIIRSYGNALDSELLDLKRIVLPTLETVSARDFMRLLSAIPGLMSSRSATLELLARVMPPVEAFSVGQLKILLSDSNIRERLIPKLLRHPQIHHIASKQIRELVQSLCADLKIKDCLLVNSPHARLIDGIKGGNQTAVDRALAEGAQLMDGLHYPVRLMVEYARDEMLDAALAGLPLPARETIFDACVAASYRIRPTTLEVFLKHGVRPADCIEQQEFFERPEMRALLDSHLMREVVTAVRQRQATTPTSQRRQQIL